MRNWTYTAVLLFGGGLDRCDGDQGRESLKRHDEFQIVSEGVHDAWRHSKESRYRRRKKEELVLEVWE